MIAILSTDALLSHMLTLEVTRAELTVCEPDKALLYLIDLDHPPRPLPRKKSSYTVGFSTTRKSDSRVDMLLPLPYATKELQAVLHRFHDCVPTEKGIGYLPHAAVVEGNKIRLSPAEEHIFAILLAAKGEIVPTQALQAALPAGSTDSNVLQVHISRLRRKLTGGGASRIRAVRGIGYRLI